MEKKIAFILGPQEKDQNCMAPNEDKNCCNIEAQVTHFYEITTREGGKDVDVVGLL